MPVITTHLHLAIKLCEKTHVEDKILFFLGNAYPDCWKISVEEGNRRHSELVERENDFAFGHMFHLWVDNHMKDVDIGDISKYDCMICDMPLIGTIVEELKKRDFVGKEAEAMNNILLLEAEPLPLYLVSDEKKERYESLLDTIVEQFLVIYKNDNDI